MQDSPSMGATALHNPSAGPLGSATFWCGSGSGDPYLWLVDPDPDSTPDQTPFFSNFKDAKKLIFSSFFYITLRHFIFSLKNLILQALFQSRYSTPLWEKGRIRIPYLTFVENFFESFINIKNWTSEGNKFGSTRTTTMPIGIVSLLEWMAVREGPSRHWRNYTTHFILFGEFYNRYLNVLVNKMSRSVFL